MELWPHSFGSSSTQLRGCFLIHKSEQDPGRMFTAEELVDEAQAQEIPDVSRRLVADWTELGILARPEFRKSSRHGSDSRVYPAAQRNWFLSFAAARKRLPLGRRHQVTGMVTVIANFWLHQGFDSLMDANLHIPTEQAQRALRTYARNARKMTIADRQTEAKNVVALVAHTSATSTQVRKAVYVYEECLRTNHWRWDLLESALNEVCTPWLPPLRQHIERGILMRGIPVRVADLIQVWKEDRYSLSALAAERVGVEDLEKARRRYILHFGYGAMAKYAQYAHAGWLPMAEMPRIFRTPLKMFFSELSEVLQTPACSRRAVD